MEEKAKEMMEKLGEEYTIWDYVSLACMTLIKIAPLVPEIVPSSKRVIGIIIDGQIIAQETRAQLNAGILPFQRKSKPD